MCEILCDSIKDHARNFEKVRRVILVLNVAAFVYVHLFEESKRGHYRLRHGEVGAKLVTWRSLIAKTCGKSAAPHALTWNFQFSIKSEDPIGCCRRPPPCRELF